VFGIDIETCPACGGAVRIIACIEDPQVIEKILTHLSGVRASPFSRPLSTARPYLFIAAKPRISLSSRGCLF
jgi:hypothetical protein